MYREEKKFFFYYRTNLFRAKENAACFVVVIVVVRIFWNFKGFLSISTGSTYEVEILIIVSHDEAFI